MPVKFFILFALFSQFPSYSQPATPGWASIKAFLPRWEGAEITVALENAPVYKAKISSQMAGFNLKLTSLSEAVIEVKNDRSANLFFFLEPGVIRITDDGRRLIASGTANNDRYNRLEKEWDSLARIQTDNSLAAVKRLKQQLTARLVADEPSSFVSLRMLYKYYHGEKDVSDTSYYRLYHLLSPDLQSAGTGKVIGEEVRRRYPAGIGRPAPDFLLPDTRKNLQPVYQKGEYTLIHFWASWCQPCRKVNQSLKNLLEMSNAGGIALVGISIDSHHSAWTTAVKKEKLDWKQLSDLKGWNSPVVNFFNVGSIPTNILIDPDGIIIARNVSADDLRKLIPKKSF